MFSKATDYAVRATIFIARNSSLSKKLGIEEISVAINSPQYFTAKILQILTKKELIKSTPGPNGGFFLLNESKQLPIRTIIDAMGESTTLDKCVLGLKECSEKSPCPMHAQYKNIKRELQELFDSKTIEMLAAEVKSVKSLRY